MGRMGLAGIVVLLACGASAPAEVQARALEFTTVDASPTLRLGDRLRVRTDSAWSYARVDAASGDTLRLEEGRETLRRSRAVILGPTSTVEVLARRPRLLGAARNAAYGLLTTVLLAVTLSSAFHGDAEETMGVSGDLVRATAPAIAACTVVGALLPGSRWVRVEFRMKPRPTQGT